MVKNKKEKALYTQKQKALKKKIHRALLEARTALHRGDEEEARIIVRRIMKEAAPEARRAGQEEGPNWVIEALKPLDELMLPDE